MVNIPATDVLYSEENTEGFYLETLMDKVMSDMHIKSFKLNTLPAFMGKETVHSNNIEILRHLNTIKELQLCSLSVMTTATRSGEL